MRVGNVLALIVMMSVVRNPFDRMTLNSENSPEGEEVLEPFVCLKALMRELSMIRHCYTEAIKKIAECEKFKHSSAIGEWSS